jgi:hypothetical protein
MEVIKFGCVQLETVRSSHQGRSIDPVRHHAFTLARQAGTPEVVMILGMVMIPAALFIVLIVAVLVGQRRPRRDRRRRRRRAHLAG